MVIKGVSLEKVISNRYVNIATLLAVPAAFLADVFGTPISYGIAFIIVIGLFVWGIRDELRKSKLYSTKTVHLPIVFNIANSASSKSALNAIFDILSSEYPNHKENLEKYLNIVESDLIFEYKGDIYNEEMFIDFLKISKHDINQLQNKILKDTHFHIVYIGPIANAIAIGTILATEGITLYQYNKSTDRYTISVEINDRSYKESVKEFRIMERQIIGNLIDSDITVAIELASHSIAINRLDEPIVYLKSKLGATITKSEDFIEANREIYTVINELQQSSNNHIRLVYSMPTTIAILVGMSIQTYWDIELTQYDRGEYKRLISSLNKIRYYF